MADRQSKRMKWTPENLQKLQIFYEEEKQRGKKNLWNRITQRINVSVHKAKRQAIQYKWKNFCKIVPDKKNKLSKNKQLIQLLLRQIPFKGYKQLSIMPQFEGATQSNLKNIFYSNIRSIANFLKQILYISQNVSEISNMLSKRQFLRILKEKTFNFIQFRRNIIQYKTLAKERPNYSIKKQTLMLQLKESLSIQYHTIRNIYIQQDADIRRKYSLPGQSLNTEESSGQTIKAQSVERPKLDRQYQLEVNNIEKKAVLIDQKLKDCMDNDLSFRSSQDEEWQFSFVDNQYEQNERGSFFGDF